MENKQYLADKMEVISCGIGPCLQPAENDPPSSTFLVVFQPNASTFTFFSGSLVLSSNHVPAWHLNGRGEHDYLRSRQGERRLWGKWECRGDVTTMKENGQKMHQEEKDRTGGTGEF